MVFCNECGTQLNEETRLCGKCGAQAVSGQSHTAYANNPGAQNKNAFQYMFEPLKKYAVFKGRARRKEFWLYALFIFIAAFILGIIDYLIIGYVGGVGILGTIFGIATFLPSLAVTWRRMRDCDKAGPFFLIPIYGWLVLPLTGGTKGSNRFGADPKH